MRRGRPQAGAWQAAAPVVELERLLEPNVDEVVRRRVHLSPRLRPGGRARRPALATARPGVPRCAGTHVRRCRACTAWATAQAKSTPQRFLGGGWALGADKCSVPARCTRLKSMHGMISAWVPLEVSYLACRVGLWYPRRPAAVRPAIHAPPLPSPPSHPTQGREAAQRAGRALCWATHAMFAASQRLRQRPTPPTASPSRNLGFSSISLNVHVGSEKLAQAALFRWRIAARLGKPRVVRSARPRMESRWSLWHVGVAPTWALLGFVAIVLPGSVAAPAPLRCATVFCLGRPSESRVQSFLKQQRAKPFNHAFVGTTRLEGTAPAAPARSLFPATPHAWQRSSGGNPTTHTAGILLQLGRERV